MKKILITTSLLFIFVISGYSQNFNSPESVAYDSKNDRFIVSNKSGNYLSQIDKNWKVSKFYENCNSPKGLFVKDLKLYVTTNTVVLIFDLNTDSLINTIKIKEASFLNDITIDHKNKLYVSDTQQNKIFKIDLQTKKYSVFIDTKKDAPNGLYFYKKMKLLYIGYWAGSRTLAIYDLNAKEKSTKKFNHAVDGIAFNKKGDLFFSSWKPTGVFQTDLNFKGELKTISTNHKGPADIAIIQKNGKEILVIPNFMKNIVDFMILKENNKIELIKTIE